MTDLYLSKILLKPEARAHGEEYPFHLPILRDFPGLTLRSRVTFLVGENGSGKSTLLEGVAVAYGFNPEGGTRNFSFSTNATHSQLYRYLTLAKGVRRAKDGFFLRAESFYNVATEVERLAEVSVFSGAPLLDSYGGKSLHERSHGESFLSLVQNRFGGHGLYILDEPEAALSPSRQLALLALMGELVREDSQFLIATHSPILMAYPGAEIYEFTERGIRLTPYEQTQHYLLTHRFLNHPAALLRELGL